MSDEKRSCSFCGKQEHEVKNLIEGEHAFICNECVETCGVMLQGQFDDADEAQDEADTGKLPTAAMAAKDLRKVSRRIGVS